jgi:hypothetical protein
MQDMKRAWSPAEDGKDDGRRSPHIKCKAGLVADADEKGVRRLCDSRVARYRTIERK